jgi:ribose 5-phosphate isomerase A
VETEVAARENGVTLGMLDGTRLDLAIDGADEVERGSLRLIKGLGGALLREKIVAEASARFVIVADDSKMVDTLGRRAPVPVEITAFGHVSVMARIAALGGKPVLRLRSDGAPFVSDGGNFIADCAGLAPVRDPYTLERQLRAIAGVVATGLFTLPVERVLVGHDDGSVTEMLPQ